MTKNEKQPFIFDTELRLVMLTGLRVRTVADLRRTLSQVPGSSIFFHTHHEYLAHNLQKPVYYSDFAVWVSQTLREDALAEKLAAIDLLAFTTVRGLREAILKTLDGYTGAKGDVTQECRPDEAFHFCRSKSFILPTGVVANDVPEFFAKLPLVSDASLYFHFFEARLRLGRRTSDFSRWLRERDRGDLADAINGLNPYIRTLDELKQDIIRIGQEAAS